VDKKGLKYEVDLPDTTAARDIHALVKRGDINKSSLSRSRCGYDDGMPAENWVWDSTPDPPRIAQRQPARRCAGGWPGLRCHERIGASVHEAKAKAPDPMELAKRAKDEREAYFKQVRERIAGLRTRL
jgi:hypothetical protein